MAVFGRLGVLLVVLSGVAILFVDGLRSPPGLWYAAAGIVAGTTIFLYTAISSPAPRRTQATPEPVSPGTCEKSRKPSTTRQTDSTPPDTEQTATSTETAKHEPESRSDNAPDPPEQPTSKKSETQSTAVKKPQHFSTRTQQSKQTSSYTSSSRTRKTSRASTNRQRHITSTAAPKRDQSAKRDNSYFKPVDSSDEIKFAQIDTRFSYIDVDLGPEFIGLDPIPDLVEVDVGPSVVSHELVRSPVEIKISSFLKALLALTPRNSCTAASNDSPQPSTVADNPARRRTDDTATRRRSTSQSTEETRYREQERRVDRHCEPLIAADRRQHPTKTWPRSSGSEPENHRPTTDDTTGYGTREETGTFDGGRSSDRRSLGWEPVTDEEPIGPLDVGVADEPVADVGMDYSPPQREPPEWDSDPFGLTDVGPRFSELEESVVESVEQPELGAGMSDWEPGALSEEPVMGPEIGTEMFGLDGFTEPTEGAVGLSGPDIENEASPLFPEAENFFPEEDAEDGWPTF